MIKQVIFVCQTCRDYNVQNSGLKDFEQQMEEMESLSDAVRDHVMFGHDVWTLYKEDE